MSRLLVKKELIEGSFPPTFREVRPQKRKPNLSERQLKVFKSMRRRGFPDHVIDRILTDYPLEKIERTEAAHARIRARKRLAST